MTSYRISRANASDAGRLTTLMHESAAYQGEYASILENYQVTEDYLATHPAFVAHAQRDVVGFYSLIEYPAELDLLFVADSAQGTGIGAWLVEHMLGEAANLGMTELRVVSHPPAAGFYERMGARRVGVVPPSPPKITWERPELVFDVKHPPHD
ncbi:N-acetylglutamate synthase, GNAT family [Amycolatopsis lurida]|uniref:Acetyltransferase n=1 Tax=Amycolatopsis lurida NRRL 2430 TaxID=1460371 RepID=A0A2P2FSA2_AMYLU|nr:GNAT family N-acetyltransferase [Amycolatopsis lurida]KFU79604.1 acetyltransferase [Amycolatopsis lurida NRRL 2430]SEC99868.1 N-acetylglutamate synthase, GNAT family [Amycolatopsis lurida]